MGILILSSYHLAMFSVIGLNALFFILLDVHDNSEAGTHMMDEVTEAQRCF